MKLMYCLMCFAIVLFIISCGGDEDEPAVASLIKSEPPSGDVITLTDDLGGPIEIELLFDHDPTFVAVGGVPAELHGNFAIWEVSIKEFLDLLKPNAMNDWDLSVTWKDPNGSEGETTLTYTIRVDDGEPPAIASATVKDGDQDIDPQPLNLGGITFTFDEPVKGNIIIQPKDGEPLNWITQIGSNTAMLTPVEGDELQHGVVYLIHVKVVDNSGRQLEFTMTFTTKDE